MARLLDEIDLVARRGDPEAVEIAGIAYDSRAVEPGDLFCCLPGERTDGHRYASDAVAAGAAVLLVERDLDLPVPQARVTVGGARPAMARLAAALWGHPDRSLTTIGVTGTNGKTTVTHLVAGVLDAAGRPAAVVGTLSGARTTPEAPDLFRSLAGLRDQGTQAVALEVSSHALAQHRVDGLRFEVAAFTNLGRDHLDYHGTMEAYFAAKASLFTPERVGTAVVLVDDPWGARLADRLVAGPPAGRVPVVAVRRDEATQVTVRPGSTSFRWRGREVRTALTGRFNVDNLLVAAATAVAAGCSEDQVVAGLDFAGPVPGRMEVVVAGPPVTGVVDYAHTPDGLTVAVAAARELADGHRVVVAFGCGGDRDRGKRGPMGAAASTADVVVVTSDNPRSEDPEAIITEIRAGIPPGPRVVVEPDRGRAIRQAVALAGPGDVVLVAGKGHEATQVVAGRSLPFDDRLELRRALGVPAAEGSDR